jgi:hypothetical protein
VPAQTRSTAVHITLFDDVLGSDIGIKDLLVLQPTETRSSWLSDNMITILVNLELEDSPDRERNYYIGLAIKT